ncbi:MAG: phosphoenolpyruvate--protein phosphotransferase [Elusimicrobiota bacterium]
MSDSKRPIKGLGVSSGIARGTAFVLLSDRHLAAPRRKLEDGEIGKELDRFDAALKTAEDELSALRDMVRQRIGKQEAEIFAAQMTVLRDPTLLKDVLHSVSHDRLNVEAALTDVIGRAARMLAELKDPYVQERAADIRDVGRRVLAVLMREHAGEALAVPEGSVVVAEELLPSVTAHMQMQGVLGLVTERGGKTSHAAILARSMGVPYVVGIRGACSVIRSGEILIVDGDSGEVFVNPAAEAESRYGRLAAELETRKEDLQELASFPSITRDGVRIVLCANVAKLEDAEAARRCGADGVGLFRTEFLFMGRERFPTEDEQFALYRELAERIKPGRVTIRVLDLGGDKILPYFPLASGHDHPLGLRGTRLLLRYPDILKTQLRAILRAGAHGPVRILFPMIVDAQEMASARHAIQDAARSLREEGRKFGEGLPAGAMIEVPAAAVLAGRIARESDFLSVGTNDLIQYLLTADRTSQDMLPYFESLHPSVLEVIRQLVKAAADAEKELAVCGEMAADPGCTGLLIGLGVRSLSVVPGRILEVRQALRSVDTTEAAGMAERCLRAASAADVREAMERGKMGAGSGQ